MNSVPAPTSRRRRALLAALAMPLLALTLPTATPTATADDAARPLAVTVSAPEGLAVTAIRGLVEEGTVSKELDEMLGYRPTQQEGFATDPAGACSSPMDLPDSFEPACGTHDLGYDLLRAADAAGESIPEELRAKIDQQFYQRITEICEDPACEVAAIAIRIAVSVNTLRQGGGAPVAEEWPWSDMLA